MCTRRPLTRMTKNKMDTRNGINEAAQDRITKRYSVHRVPDPLTLDPTRPHLTNCQLHEFTAALLRPVHSLSLDQQSGIHCLIICAIQLLTPNNLGGT